MAGLRDDDYLGDVNIVSLKENLIQRARGGARAIRELDNTVNMRWYYGQPWYRRAPETNKIVGLAPDQRQRYIHVNKTFDVCRTIKGVMYYDPAVEPKPKTIDAEDVARAQMSADLGNSIIQSGGLASAYSKVLDLCNITGLGFIKVSWDPSAGQRRPMFGQEPCPICKGTGATQGIMGQTPCYYCSAQGLVPGQNGWQGTGMVDRYIGTEPEGNVVFTPVHMDDVFLDPEANSVDDCFEMIHRARISKHKAWQLYGKGLGYTEEDFRDGAVVDDTPSYLTRVGAQYQLPADREYVKVYEYYRKPDEKHPEGMFAVIIGNQAMVAGRLPYVHDIEPFPLISFPMYEVHGLLYPVSTVDLVLPLVIAYNDHLSTLHTRARLSAKLRFKVPRTTNFEVDDRSGNVYYSPTPRGDAPSELQLSPAPTDTANMIQVLGDAIDSLSSATDVMKGNFNSGDASARAMAFVEERSVGPLKPIIAEHARRLDRVIKYGIDLCRLFYDDGRLIRLEGASGGTEVREFRVENIGESTDVKLVTVRDIGRSRAVLMNELNEAARNQMIDQETYMSLAEFGDMGDLYKERKMHRDHSCMENQLLVRNGQMPPPMKYQNHVIHLKEHAKKMVELQTTDPNHQAIPILMQHMEMTEQVQSQERVAQQMMDQQNAAAYGMQNAGDPSKQPASPVTPEGAPSAEPVSNAEPAPPEGQQALDVLDQRISEGEQ